MASSNSSELSDYDDLSDTSSIDHVTFDLLNYKIKHNKLLLKINLLEQSLSETQKENQRINSELKHQKRISFCSLSGGFLLLYIYFLKSFEPKIIYT
jgi:hypothetical protein